MKRYTHFRLTAAELLHMVPAARTVEEALAIFNRRQAAGLKRSHEVRQFNQRWKTPKVAEAKGDGAVSRKERRSAHKLHAPAARSIFDVGQVDTPSPPERPKKP